MVFGVVENVMVVITKFLEVVFDSNLIMCVKMIVLNRGDPDERSVPCGRCHECISAKINGWVMRLKYQQKNSINNLFLTLTYDDEHLPFTIIDDFEFDNNDNCVDNSYYSPCFNKDHLRDFIRSIRDKIRYSLKIKGFSKEEIKKVNKNFKYFIVSEYGSESKRPHYHALFFGLPDGFDWYSEIAKLWYYGFVGFGKVADGSIVYCAAYLFKDPFYYRKDIPKELKPFMLCSNGIGESFVTTEVKNYFKSHVTDRFQIDGVTYKLPRYILEKIFPLLVCRLIGEKNISDNNDKIFESIEKYGLKEYLRIQNSINKFKRDRFIKKNKKTKI